MEIIKKIKYWGVIPTIKNVIALVKRYTRLFFWGFSSPGREDEYVSKFFPKDYKGFYVDIGTNDPVILNNTYYFHRRGWKGINIEPNPECFNRILSKRPRDTNLNIGLGKSNGVLDYYLFYPDLVSTFSKCESEENIKSGYRLISIVKIPVRRLENVLDEYLLENQEIDFMSIDTEGYDFLILENMNINKYKPRFICLEDFKDNNFGKINNLLVTSGYRKVFSNTHNSIYERVPK